MATTLLKTLPFKSLHPLPPLANTISLSSPKPFHVCFEQKLPRTSCPLRFCSTPNFRVLKLVPFASNGGEAETTETEQEVNEQEIEDTSDGAVAVEEAAADDDESIDVEGTSSAIISLLKSYKEALASSDESKIADIEAFFNSFEDEKVDLEKKVASLSEELSVEKDRILRISADFDNFRKRTDRERLSLVTNAQGEVLENLLPVLDNFERAKSQIKIDTEGEEKINNSYQSIYKQFMEILGSLGVESVETVGNPFDPMLHEAIMREDSTEYEEGIILEEYRKGFKIGDRLLRPSMVKVSAGPGPEKVEQGESLEGTDVGETIETSETGESNETAENGESSESRTGAESS